jgi:hypothetical protein
MNNDTLIIDQLSNKRYFENPRTLQHNNINDMVDYEDISEYNIFINTSDRDMSVYSSPYDVKVKFSPSTSYYQQTIHYIDSDIKGRGTYTITTLTGDIGTPTPNIPKELTNVKYVSINSVIVPKYVQYVKAIEHLDRTTIRAVISKYRTIHSNFSTDALKYDTYITARLNTNPYTYTNKKGDFDVNKIVDFVEYATTSITHSYAGFPTSIVATTPYMMYESGGVITNVQYVQGTYDTLILTKTVYLYDASDDLLCVRDGTDVVKKFDDGKFIYLSISFDVNEHMSWIDLVNNWNYDYLYTDPPTNPVDSTERIIRIYDSVDDVRCHCVASSTSFNHPEVATGNKLSTYTVYKLHYVANGNSNIFDNTPYLILDIPELNTNEKLSTNDAFINNGFAILYKSMDASDDHYSCNIHMNSVKWRKINLFNIRTLTFRLRDYTGNLINIVFNDTVNETTESLNITCNNVKNILHPLNMKHACTYVISAGVIEIEQNRMISHKN